MEKRMFDNNFDSRFYITKEGNYRTGYSAHIKDVIIEELNNCIKKIPNGTIITKAERLNDITEYIIIVDYPIKLNIHEIGMKYFEKLTWFEKINSEILIKDEPYEKFK